MFVVCAIIESRFYEGSRQACGKVNRGIFARYSQHYIHNYSLTHPCTMGPHINLADVDGSMYVLGDKVYVPRFLGICAFYRKRSTF